MEEDILSWLERTVLESQFQWNYWDEQKMLDLDGWKGIFTSFLQGSSYVGGGGIVLTGADHHSKQIAALPMISLLTGRSYAPVFLDGADLGAGGIGAAKQKIDHLLNRFYDEEKGICFVLDGMEFCDCRRELLRFLGQVLCEYRMRREQISPLFLILLHDDMQDIPSMLRSCLRVCRVQLPNQERRAAFLAARAKSLRNYLSLDVFAQHTEGASYMQLQDMIALLEGHIDSLDGRGLSDDELRAILSAQMPVSEQDPSMGILCRSLQQLVDQLPQIIRSGTVAQQPTPVVQPQQPLQVQPSPTGNSREEIENMPPRQLAIELFGEERVKELEAIRC